MVTVVTYIYPSAVRYINDFISSLSNQTFSQFKLLVFNDGVENPHIFFSKFKNSIEIINVYASISKIRFDSFVILQNYDTDFFVFLDVDDTMSKNRLEICRGYLDKYDLVCNDLNIIDSDGNVKAYSQWKERLGDEFEFDHRFLFDKNILGFTNTAIKKELLAHIIVEYEKITAVDWFIFFQLLYQSRATAIFTSKCLSNYRQHEHNIGGIGNIDKARILYVLRVKKAHYLALAHLGIDTDNYLAELVEQEKKVTTYINNNSSKTVGMFWWEETKYLYEKN